MSKNTPSLRELEHSHAFVERHIGPNDAEIAQMLDVVGHTSLDALTDAIVPAGIKSPAPLALPESLTEVEALAKIRAIADKNQVLSCATCWRIRAGTRRTRPTRRRSRRAGWKRWSTSRPCHRPHRPGVANASLLDEGTAAAEAMAIAFARKRKSRHHRRRDADCTRRPSPWCAPAPSRWASRWCWRAGAPAAVDRRAEALRGAAAVSRHDRRGARHRAGDRRGAGAGGLAIVAADLLALTC
jgi:hypothetical protein